MAVTPLRVIRTDDPDALLRVAVKQLKGLDASINEYLLDDESAPPWTLQGWQAHISEVVKRIERARDLT